MNCGTWDCINTLLGGMAHWSKVCEVIDKKFPKPINNFKIGYISEPIV